MKAIIVLLILLFIALISLILLFFPNLKKLWEKAHFRKSILKTLVYYADENDQLLLNDISMIVDPDSEDDESQHYAHLMFTDKFVFVVEPFYQQGGIYGNNLDNKLFLKTWEGGIEDVVNPIIDNEWKTNLLLTGLNADAELFVSVVVYNNSLIVPDSLQKREKNSYFIPLKDLQKVILEIENQDVQPIAHEKTQMMLDEIKAHSDLLKKRSGKNKKGGKK